MVTKTVIFSSNSGFNFAQSLEGSGRGEQGYEPKECGDERGDPIINIESSFSLRKSIIKSSKVTSLEFRIQHRLSILKVAKLLL